MRKPDVGLSELRIKFVNLDIRNLYEYLWVIPAAVLLPVLTRPVPFVFHSNRALAIGFETLALLQDGLSSYTYITYQESFASLHLHAILGAPLFALGVTEASRLVSFLAAIFATVLISRIATRLFNNQVGIIAPLLLWLNPYFIRFAYYAWPESLSIALTTGAIYTALRSNESTFWTGLTACFIILGAFNHRWELTVLLPVVAIYISRSNMVAVNDRVVEFDVTDYSFQQLVGVGCATVLSYLVLTVVTGLQPANDQSQYFITGQGTEALVTPEFWFHPIATGRPGLFMISHNWHLYLGVLCTLFLADRYVRTRSRWSLVLLTWVISGLSVPILLVGGFHGHLYYLWGVVAPVTIVAAVLVVHVVDFIAGSISPSKVSPTFAAVAIVLAAAGGGIVYSQEATWKASDPDRGVHYPAETTLTAAEEIRQYNVTSQEEVAFVGNWTGTNSEVGIDVPRLLLYSRVLIRGEQVWSITPGTDNYYPSSEVGPTFAPNESIVGECDVMIVRQPNQIDVRECS